MFAKFAKIAFVVLVALFVCTAPALAQTHAESVELAKAPGVNYGYLAAGIAAGLATIGGAYGIGKLAAAAMEGTARQPEAGGAIRVSMIIAAALIEGFVFFALIVCHAVHQQGLPESCPSSPFDALARGGEDTHGIQHDVHRRCIGFDSLAPFRRAQGSLQPAGCG